MNDQWLKRWEEGRISFHEGQPNPLLMEHFENLHLKTGSKCLIPLCGKAVDIRWIYKQGHLVTGIELSEIAISDFYNEQHVSTNDPRLELIRKDFFEYQTPTPFEWLYDRAALIALPPNLRQSYVNHCKLLLKPQSIIALISFSFVAQGLEGPPYSVSDEEVHELYSFAQVVEKVAWREPKESVAHLLHRASNFVETLWKITL